MYCQLDELTCEVAHDRCYILSRDKIDKYTVIVINEHLGIAGLFHYEHPNLEITLKICQPLCVYEPYTFDVYYLDDDDYVDTNVVVAHGTCEQLQVQSVLQHFTPRDNHHVSMVGVRITFAIIDTMRSAPMPSLYAHCIYDECRLVPRFKDNIYLIPQCFSDMLIYYPSCCDVVLSQVVSLVIRALSCVQTNNSDVSGVVADVIHYIAYIYCEVYRETMYCEYAQSIPESTLMRLFNYVEG